MDARFMNELAQIQKYAAGMKNLLSQAEANAPEQSEGTDRSGALRVILGPDGFPMSIRVDANWKKRIDPSEFGAAVGEAFSSAMGERMSTWTESLRESGWQSEFEQLRYGSAEPATNPETSEIPAAFRRESKPVEPRSLGHLTEEMMQALDKVDQTAENSTTTTEGVGTAASSKLTLVLSKGGGLSCTAEPRWVSQQSGAQLMTHLSEALTAAREDLASKASNTETAAPDAGADESIDELLTLLNDPQRLANS